MEESRVTSKVIGLSRNQCRETWSKVKSVLRAIDFFCMLFTAKGH